MWVPLELRQITLHHSGDVGGSPSSSFASAALPKLDLKDRRSAWLHGPLIYCSKVGFRAKDETALAVLALVAGDAR